MEDVLQKPATAARSRWSLKRKLLLGLVVLLTLFGIGLGVGLGVGLTRENSSDQSGELPDDSSSSASDGSSGNGTNANSLERSSRWKPAAGTTWQIILADPMTLDGAAKPVPDVQAFDLDLYDNDAAVLEALQKNGKKVICYFSAGSYEDWRSDKNEFQKSDIGKPLDGWPGEWWLNVSSPNVRTIMGQRIRMAAAKGCDAIDPDNVDGYSNDNGLGLTQDDAIDYLKFLSSEAARYNMSSGLKNAGDIISSVVSFLDFSVNEQCVQYSECATFSPFVDAGKPVFNIEYPPGAPGQVSGAKRGEICSNTGNAEGASNFSHVMKDMDLTGWVEYCDGKQYTTQTEDN